jgi:hypothetical protein
MSDMIQTAPSRLMVGASSGLWIQMAEIQRAKIPLEELQLPKTPSGLRLPCREISESHDTLGCYVKYCKRYWATQMMDYGTTRCPEAEQYINDHKLAWKAQAERSKIHGPAGDESEYKGRRQYLRWGFRNVGRHLYIRRRPNGEFSDGSRLSRVVPPALCHAID